MKRILLAFLLLAATCLGVDVSFVTNVSLSNTTNNIYTAKLGARCVNTSGLPIVITQVGRWKISGNSQVHTVGVYSGTLGGTATPLATTTIDM